MKVVRGKYKTRIIYRPYPIADHVRLLVALTITAIIFSLTACASKPPLPTDLDAAHVRIRQLEDALKECDQDVNQCADLLQDCEASSE